jgi:hypothetical protein
MGDIYIVFVLFIPIFGMLFWSYHYPEDSLLWGKRWMFKEEPELTDIILLYTSHLVIYEKMSQNKDITF